MNNVRTNTKGMGINLERLADLVVSMDERQESTAKSVEMIHILVIYLQILTIFRRFSDNFPTMFSFRIFRRLRPFL